MWSAGLALAGCNDKNAAPVVQPTTPIAAPAVATPSDADSAPVDNEIETQDEESISDSPAIDPAPTASEADSLATPKHVAPVVDETRPIEKPPAERLAILTPGGPLLVDARLTIGGKRLTEAFDASVQRVLEVGDSDKDGQSTWKELATDRTYLEKEMPKAPAADSRQMKTLIERYDENRDGKIQPGEAAAWLGRDAGTSAKPLAIRSTRSYRPVPRATSQVWHLIDSNDDGRLVSEEIAGASNQLLALDADDDRILAPGEMASLREQLAAAGQQRTYVPREANHYAVMHLNADLDVDRLHYLLSDLYAPQQNLGPNSFSELSVAFKKLDANSDAWLDAEELAAMRTVEAHLEIDVAFEEPATEKLGTATIEVKSLTPEVAVAAQPSADRVIISLGNTRLILSTHNLLAKSEDEPNATSAGTGTRSQIRLMVHDRSDALFEELDANADGRLGEREIAYCSQRLAERDRNGDGELSGDEFPYSLIVAFLLGEQPSERSFYVPPSAAVSTTESDEPLPAWFKHADLNGDGDVSRREFLGSGEQFDQLDANKDGYVGPAEAVM
jgi:Ca2+-binding EF-hand superfamily protein